MDILLIGKLAFLVTHGLLVSFMFLTSFLYATQIWSCLSDCVNSSHYKFCKIFHLLQDCRVIIWTNDGTSNNWTSKVLNKFKDVVWHLSWSITGNILAVSGGDNKVSCLYEPRHKKTGLQGFPTRSDTNRAVQPQEKARGLKISN